MDVSSVVTVTVSVLSLVLSIGTACFYLQDRRRARYQLEHSFVEDVLTWHKDVVLLLCRLGSSGVYVDVREKRCDLCALSAAIEQGRFLFPNIIEGDEAGAEKPLAYRGYRNLTLEFLIGAYDACNQDVVDSRSCEHYRRLYTSMVYEVIDPLARVTEISSLVARKLSTDKTVRDYLTDELPKPRR